MKEPMQLKTCLFRRVMLPASTVLVALLMQFFSLAKAERTAPVTRSYIGITGDMYKDLVTNVKRMKILGSPSIVGGNMTLLRRSSSDAKRNSLATVNSYSDFEKVISRGLQANSSGRFKRFALDLEDELGRYWKYSNWLKDLYKSEGAFPSDPNEVIKQRNYFVAHYISAVFGLSGFPSSFEAAQGVTKVPDLRLWFVPTEWLTAGSSYLTTHETNSPVFFISNGTESNVLRLSLLAYSRARKIIPINSYNAREVVKAALNKKVVFDLPERRINGFGCPATTTFQRRSKPKRLVCLEQKVFGEILGQSKVSQNDAKALIKLFRTTVAKVNQTAVDVSKNRGRNSNDFVSEEAAKEATRKRSVVSTGGRVLMQSIEEASGLEHGHVVYSPSSASNKLGLPTLVWFSNSSLDSRMFTVRKTDILEDIGVMSTEAVDSSDLKMLADISQKSLYGFNKIIAKYASSY